MHFIKTSVLRIVASIALFTGCYSILAMERESLPEEPTKSTSLAPLASSATPLAHATLFSVLPKDIHKIIIPQIVEDTAIPFLNGKCLEKRRLTLNGHIDDVKAVMFTHDTDYTKGTIYERALISGSLGQHKNVFYWYPDKKTKKESTTFIMSDGIFSIASSLDGSKYILTSKDFSSIVAIDINNKEEPITNGITSMDYTIISAAFNPEGNKICYGLDTAGHNHLIDGNVYIADVTTLTGIITSQQLAEKHVDSLRSVAWSKDGEYMLSGSRGKEKNLILWKVKTNTRFYFPRFIPNELYDVNAVAFSPDSKMIAFGGKAKEGQPNLFLCDISNPENLIPLQGHSQDVFAIAFSSGGNELFSGSSASNDSLIRWNIRRDLNAITPTVAPNFSKSVNCIAVNDDGTQMAVGCNGNYDNLFLIKFLSKQETEDLKNLDSINQARFVNKLCKQPLVNQAALSLDQAEQRKFSKLPQEVQKLLTLLLDIENAPQLQVSIEKTPTPQALPENKPDTKNPLKTVFPRKIYSEKDITQMRAGQQAQAERNIKRLTGGNTLQLIQQNPTTPEDNQPENKRTPGNIFTATFRSIVNWIASSISSLVDWLFGNR